MEELPSEMLFLRCCIDIRGDSSHCVFGSFKTVRQISESSYHTPPTCFVTCYSEMLYLLRYGLHEAV